MEHIFYTTFALMLFAACSQAAETRFVELELSPVLYVSSASFSYDGKKIATVHNNDPMGRGYGDVRDEGDSVRIWALE